MGACVCIYVCMSVLFQEINTSPLYLTIQISGGSVNVQAKAGYKQPTDEGRLDDSLFAEFEFILKADGDIYEPRSPRSPAVYNFYH